MAYEVDRKWKSHGLPCVVIALDMGHRCGYVGVPKEHPLYGKSYNDVIPNVKKSDLGEELIGDRGVMSLLFASLDGEDVRGDLYFDVHGSLTYSGDGKKGYPVKAPVWWFGFDCAHAGDENRPQLKEPKYVMELTRQMESQLLAHAKQIKEYRAADKDTRIKMLQSVIDTGGVKSEMGMGGMLGMLSGGKDI